MAASCEDIRQIWRDNIFSHATMQAITPVLIEQDLTENTHKEVSKLRHQGKINFFAMRVSSSLETLMGGKYRVRFFVDISYNKWADPDGTNYNDVISAIEALQLLYITELGSNWGGLVAYGEPQQGQPSVTVSQILTEPVFRADYNFSGYLCNI